jgi:predicted ATP-binding protein involved in virulence
MHVQWQRYIVTALRELSPESHFIVTTHSMDVLDSALSDERILLARDDELRTALRTRAGLPECSPVS